MDSKRLIVALTVACCSLSWVTSLEAARYSIWRRQSNCRNDVALNVISPPKYPIVGKLTDGDLAAIEKIVSEESGYPIMKIEVKSHEEVKVKTGIVRSRPSDASGHNCILKKKDGTWGITSSGRWYY